MILAIGAIAFATKQLNLGIDFESGTRIQAALAEPASVDDVRQALSDGNIDDASAAKIQETENPDFGANVIQISAQIPPDQVTKVQALLEDQFGLEGGDQSFDSQSVGPTFGAQVANKALIAIIFSLLVISPYVAIRFEAKYAVPVLIALVHDILITAGIYALVGQEVTSGTVAAFLTILGYSMYDTIIVFDRVRENVPRMPRAAFSQIVNRSMSEVLTRSLITGLSTVFLIGVLLVFGGETLKDFAFAMMVGVASGTYSSIFIAAPVLTEWKEREPAYRSRRARIEEAMGRVPTFPEDNVVARIDEVERHVPDAAAADGEGRGDAQPHEAPAPTAAPVAVADPPVERAAPVEPTPEESGDGVAGRPEANAERARKREERKAQRMKQSQAPAQAREVEIDGAVGLGHHRGRALALHGLPARPVLGRDRRRAARRGDRRHGHRSARPDRDRRQHRPDGDRDAPVRDPGDADRDRGRVLDRRAPGRGSAGRARLRADRPAFGALWVRSRRGIPSQALLSLAACRNPPPGRSRSSPTTTARRAR